MKIFLKFRLNSENITLDTKLKSLSLKNASFVKQTNYSY